MAPALVQAVVSNPVAADNEYAATTTPSVTLGSNTTVGSVCIGTIYTTEFLGSISAPSGWSGFTFQDSVTGAGVGGIFWIPITTGGTQGKTFAPGTGNATGSMTVQEWGGLSTSSPVDTPAEGTNRTTSASGLTVTGGAASTSQLWVAVFYTGGALGGSLAITSYTIDYRAQEGGHAHQIVSGASATPTAVASSSFSGVWAGLLVPFNAAAAGGAAQPKSFESGTFTNKHAPLKSFESGTYVGKTTSMKSFESGAWKTVVKDRRYCRQLWVPERKLIRL